MANISKHFRFREDLYKYSFFPQAKIFPREVSQIFSIASKSLKRAVNAQSVFIRTYTVLTYLTEHGTVAQSSTVRQASRNIRCKCFHPPVLVCEFVMCMCLWIRYLKLKKFLTDVIEALGLLTSKLNTWRTWCNFGNHPIMSDFIHFFKVQITLT